MENYITEINQLSAGRYLIFINGAPAFPMYNSEIKKYNIKQDSVLSDDELEKIKNDVIFSRALNKSLNLIKTKEYTQKEIHDKLSHSYYPEDVIEQVLESLKKSRFTDDLRYAESYIAYYGEIKSSMIIRHTLEQKGIDKEIIDEAFEKSGIDCDENDLKICFDLISSRFSNINPEDFKQRNKIKSFLARKGFSYSIADSAIKEYYDL